MNAPVAVKVRIGKWACAHCGKIDWHEIYEMSLHMECVCFKCGDVDIVLMEGEFQCP
jgi:hypothetical protein